MSEKYLPEGQVGSEIASEFAAAQEEVNRLSAFIDEKQIALANAEKTARDLMYPKNPEAKMQRTLTVPPHSFAEFYTADSALTAIPDEARLLVASTNPQAVALYVRPYGPNGSTLGEGISRADRGRPAKVWDKGKSTRTASGESIGMLEQTLWALNPGDAVYVHTPGKSKYVECYQITRPTAARTLVAKRIPSSFERSTNTTGSFSAHFVEGAWDRVKEINDLKAEIEQADKQKSVVMRPFFAARLESVHARYLALNQYGLVMNEDHFTVGEYGARLEYCESTVAEVETELEKIETNTKNRSDFESLLDEKIKARLSAIEAECTDNGTYLSVYAPKHEKFTQAFWYTREGFQDLIKFLDTIQIKINRQIVQVQTARESAAQEARAAELGLPGNIQIFHRRGGNTKLSDGWVIKPNGELRMADVAVSGHTLDGTQTWRQLLPGELALSWSKDYSAAEQVFDVVYNPGTVTAEQIQAVAKIQQELAEERGAGRGWGFGAPAVVTPPKPVSREYTYSNFQETNPPQETKPPVETTTFSYSGKRDFKCSCGCFERVGSGAMTEYNAGKEITITCGSCKKSALVKKQ